VNRLYLVTIYIGVLYFLTIFTSCSGNTEDQVSSYPAHLDELENVTIFSNDSAPITYISFEREILFGDTPDQPIGRTGGFAVDDLGRIYLSDVQKNTLYVFEPDGSYLTSVGRSGNGPGEYLAGPFPVIRSDQLFLLDIRKSRVNQYSIADLELVRGININPTNKGSFDELVNAQFNQIYVVNGKKLLVRLSTYIPTVPDDAGELKDDKLIYHYLMGDDARLTKPLTDPVPLYEITGKPAKQFQFEGPFRRVTPKPQLFIKPIVTVSDKGNIYTAMSDQLLVKKYSSGGDYQSAIYHPFNHLKMNYEDAVNSQKTPFLADLVSQNELPETWPAMDDMLADDEGRLWVATIVEDLSVYEWWVLEDSGELITKFKWPRDEPIEVIKNGKIYTRETDEDTGLQRVVRYGIVM